MGRGIQRAMALAVFALALFVLSQTLRLGGSGESDATRAPIRAVTPTPSAPALRDTPAPTPAGEPQAGFPTPAVGQVGGFAVLIPAQDWYTIQFGAYSTAEAAEQQAGLYTARGAAGYILQDDRFRVLAATYATREDAETIQARLRATQGIESYIYRLSTEEVELSVTAAEAQIQALRDGFAAVRAAIEEMGRLSTELDRQSIDGGTVILGAQEARQTVQNARRALEEVLGSSGSEVVAGLRALLQNADSGLETICAQNAQESVRITSKIKYHQIDLLWRYVQYIRGITAQRL
jgi:hypothetical protein